MQAIHKDLAKTNFPSCETVKTAKYCTETGLLATDTCGSTAVGYYKSDYAPKCEGHSGGHKDEPDEETESTAPSDEPESTPETPSDNPEPSQPESTEPVSSAEPEPDENQSQTAA